MLGAAAAAIRTHDGWSGAFPAAKPYELDHLQSALTALSGPSHTSLDLLNAHLRTAEERAEAAHKRLEAIDTRLAQMLALLPADSERIRTTAEEPLSLEAKLDLLAQGLEMASAGSKPPSAEQQYPGVSSPS
jgi:hypothetical protein